VIRSWNQSRANCSSTEGLVRGITTPEICSGTANPVTLVVSLLGWKERRISLGNNGCESQAIYEAEDKGVTAGLIFALLQGLS